MTARGITRSLRSGTSASHKPVRQRPVGSLKAWTATVTISFIWRPNRSYKWRVELTSIRGLGSVALEVRLKTFRRRRRSSMDLNDGLTGRFDGTGDGGTGQTVTSIAVHTNTTRTSAKHATVQKAALAVGIVFLPVGILGFMLGMTFNYDPFSFASHNSEAMSMTSSQTSILHSIVHLLFWFSEASPCPRPDPRPQTTSSGADSPISSCGSMGEPSTMTTVRTLIR